MKLPYGLQTKEAVANAVPGAVEKALACLAATWMTADGLDFRTSHYMSAVQFGAVPHAACALDVVRLLEQSLHGREALRDLGFEGFLQNVEGE